MLPSFCNESVVVVRAKEKDSRGTKILDWSDTTRTTLNGCSVQPNTSIRDFDGRAVQVTEDWVLYAPPGADIKAGDRIEWNSTAFEINGAPMTWKSPTGRVSHIWAKLVEWRG